MFNPMMFERLVGNIKRHTRQTSDEGRQLKMSVGVWHSHELDPSPTVAEIIESARKASIRS